MEFHSPEALKDYLREHPKADKSKHTVKKPEKEEPKTEEKAPQGKPQGRALFSPSEIEKLPKEVSQKTSDPDKLFEQAKDSHEHQLNWLNHGKGLDKAIGAKVVRGDKKEEMPDFSEPGPVILIGPIKSRARVDEKAKTDYDGDYGQVRDLVRASVAVDSMDQLDDVVAKLKASGLKLAKQPKDRFADPTESGYRDIIMNVEYPNGHIGELQLHLKPILKAKGAGHKFYEEVRTIEAKAKKEGRTTMTEEETKIVDEANRKAKALYDAAWEQATGKPAGNREKNAALVRASMRQAAATKYYEYDDRPAYYERGKFPKLILGKGERTIYELEEFFREALPLSEAEFKEMLRDQEEPSKKKN